ncbi:hypothetical protein EDB89DRAFT_1906181 [Lactarius sanguifluus]|nr:hypothetical protein EDB89DRAFT_1906181 [Lactarius sanguifluus]
MVAVGKCGGVGDAESHVFREQPKVRTKRRHYPKAERSSLQLVHGSSPFHQSAPSILMNSPTLTFPTATTTITTNVELDHVAPASPFRHASARGPHLPPIHDLHHQYLAARKPPEPRHDMQDPPLTRLHTSLTPDTIATSPRTSPAMAATTDPSPRHPTRRTRPQPPTHQHDATTQLARPHNQEPTATHPDPVHKATNPVTVTPQHGAQDYNPPPPSHCHTPQHGVQHRNCQPTATTWQHDATQHARLQPATANPPPRTLIQRPTPQPPTHCHGATDDAQDSATANPLRRHGSYPHHAATPRPHLTIWCDCDQMYDIIYDMTNI